MKKMSYFVVFIIFFMMFFCDAFALEIVKITGNEVRLRSKSTTDSEILNVLYSGDELTLLDKNGGVAGNGCGSVWYKAQYGSNVGYVCSQYAKIETVAEVKPEDYKEYSDYLIKAGFPSTYISYIIELHAKHPTWQFRPMVINANFDYIIGLENKSDGTSLIEDTGNYIDGYKSVESWSYNYLTNVFNNNFYGGGKYWYAANKQTISYYLDPRNFLNEKQVFMFESLSYNSSFHTVTGIQEMLKGTFMENGYSDKENKKSYADAFLDAAVKYNVSPYVLISRVIQEVGAQGSTIVSGTVKDYEGYYNFYNIKAAGNGSTETINNGLKYAKEQGWDNQYKAIVGGAVFLVEGYIKCGQDTLYLQKWDMLAPNYTAHQYMQNIQAPSTESIKTYRGYENIKMVESAFVFTIPVFNNMPDKTVLPNSGNPNNYLSSLAVNGTYLLEKPSTETKFEINLSTNSPSIDIAATKVSYFSVINGTGSVSLTKSPQEIPITVTAQNGDVRTYIITVTKNVSEAIAISEMIRLSEIKNDGTYAFGFTVGTNVSDIIKKISDTESKATVNIIDKDKKDKTSGIIASGDIIKIKTSKEEKEFIIIIYGDVNGDGKISSSDYVNIKNHIMDVKKLTDLEKLYADANKDGKVSSADYVTIKNHIMEVKSIVQ